MLKDITTKLCILSEEVMKYDEFMEILKEIDSLLDLSKDNIVKKIKAELQKKIQVYVKSGKRVTLTTIVDLT